MLVERAGDVIPHVVQLTGNDEPATRRTSTSRPAAPPAAAKRQTPRRSVTRCINTSCPAQRRERIRRFGNRDAIDIHGLGDAVVTQLVDRRLVTDVADLYQLTAADLTALDRVGPRTARNLVRAIDQSRTRVTLARLLYALGIPGVGHALAATLAACFDSLDQLAATDAHRLAQLDGVGPAAASNIAAWFRDDRTRALLARLARHGIPPHAGASG